jgi:hypothetical protein
MRQGQGVKDRMSRELGHEVDIHGHPLWVFPDPPSGKLFAPAPSRWPMRGLRWREESTSLT